MKRIVLLASLAAALVASADYKDWAKPENQQAAVVGLRLKVGTGTIDTNFTEDPATVKPENIYNSLVASIDAQEIPQNAKNAFTLAAGAMAQAIHAAMTARLNEKKIDQLSASVESLVGITAADKVDASGNVISKGNIDEMRSKLLAKKQSIAKGGSSSTGEGSSAQPIQIKVTEFNYDTKEFEQIVADSKSKMGIKGFKDLTGSESGLGGASSWALAGYNWYLPTANSKDDNIYWRRWNGWNPNVFSAGDDTEGGENSEQLRLRNWNGGSGGCDLTFQKMLTDAEDPDYASARGTHTVLTRVNDGGTYKLHYMSFDSSTIGGSGFGVDDMSVTTNTANGAVSQGVLSLYGYADAEESAASSETKVGYIPYVDGSEELGWCGFSEFFNENVFTTDDDGKIILNGIEDAEEDDIMVVTAKGASGSQEVSVKKLDGDVFAADTDSKVSLSGWGDTATTYLFEDEDDDATIEVPVKAAVTGGSELQWRVVGGIDTGALEVDATSHKVTLKGFNTTSADCETTLTSMLTDEADEDNRDTHELLARYSGGDNDTVHWVKIGDMIEMPDVLADNCTITTNSEYGAVEDGKLSLYDFETANDGATEDSEPYIPYADGEDTLGWAAFSSFFADSVFKKSEETGKILLNGTTEEGKVKVLTLTGNGEDDQTLGTLGFDNASVDGNIDAGSAVQLHAFATAPSPYSGSQNFADALTNTSVTIAQMSVPVRVPDSEVTAGFSVKYIPMGKVTGIPAAAVDNKTISIDDEDADNPKLQIIDAKTAEEGYVLQMGEEHTAGWKKLASDDNTGIVYPQGVGSGESLNEPIEITDHNDGTYGIGLRNWDTETQDFLYGSKDAIPSQITFDETIEVNDESEIELAGYTDAEVGSMAYKSSSGLDWLDLPNSGSALLSLTKNSTPEAVKLGESLQKETVAGEKVINVKNFTNGGNCSATLGAMLTTDSSNRSKHQLMARYSSGGSPSVHWVPIGEVAGGGAPVDGVSITTNMTDGAVADGDASIYGYSQQSHGAIPFKGASNLQWIEPPSSGEAVVTLSADSDATTSELGGSLEISSSKMNVTGYSGANNGSVPSKNGNGISWIIPVTGVQTYNGAPLTTVDEGNTRKIMMNTASGASASAPKALLSDGSTIYWGNQAVVGGSALIVEGTSGSTVTSATCTNKLSFVSASDSNVKFTVTDEGNGNVKVTVGVYWTN